MFNKRVNERIDRAGMIVKEIKRDLQETRMVLRDLLKYLGLTHVEEMKTGMINGCLSLISTSRIEKMSNKVGRPKKVK